MPQLNRAAVPADCKKAAALENPLVKSIYKTADNPDFTVFYLEDAHGVITDFSGNTPFEF